MPGTEHAKLSEQTLGCVTLGRDVKILCRTLWCQQPLMTGDVSSNCYKAVGTLLVARPGVEFASNEGLNPLNVFTSERKPGGEGIALF